MTHPIMLQELGRQRADDVRRTALRGHKRETLMAALHDTTLFSFATDRDLRSVAKHAERLVASEGSTIVREGERADRFYVVIEGCVRVSRNGRKVCDLGAGR